MSLVKLHTTCTAAKIVYFSMIKIDNINSDTKLIYNPPKYAAVLLLAYHAHNYACISIGTSSWLQVLFDPTLGLVNISNMYVLIADNRTYECYMYTHESKDFEAKDI